ncbi:MAG: hypothetical protein WCG85_00475 [Polyangia bacterium]
MKFVRHVKKPGWGVGRVLKDDGGDVLTYFEAVGPIRLRKSLAQLEDVPDEDIGESDILRHLRPDEKGNFAAPPLTFEEMVQNFIRIEGGGFEQPRYLAQEREYKDKAVEMAADLLGKARLTKALREGNFAAIFEAYKKVVQATNLLSIFEKARLTSLPAANYRALAEVLVDLLAGEGLIGPRFDRLAETFLDLGIGSWPTCTYGLFVTDPATHLVVKPMFVQRAAKALGYEISYKAHPTAETYERILNFASYLREKLTKRGMVPRDMIDVQGFIWLGTGGADGV